MHRTITRIGLAAVLLPAATAAQETRVFSEPLRAFAYAFGDNENRAVIGVTTSTGSARDTLGVLITSLVPRGPAERAGLEEGNRIASVNGVNLRLAPADVGDWEMSSAMSRRLTRELGKLDPGADVELRVYSGGQFRNVRVKTAAYDSLYPSRHRVRRDADDRAALGIALGGGASRRDTLGVLITWLDDDGPAAKAGLEEGNRIQAIGGVDLRVSRDDAGDDMISGIKAQRLHRELEKVKAGDEVELRIYSDGRTRTVRVKTVEASSLSRRSRIMHYGPGAVVTPRAPQPPMPARAMMGRTIL